MRMRDSCVPELLPPRLTRGGRGSSRSGIDLDLRKYVVHKRHDNEKTNFSAQQS